MCKEKNKCRAQVNRLAKKSIYGNMVHKRKILNMPTPKYNIKQIKKKLKNRKNNGKDS